MDESLSLSSGTTANAGSAEPGLVCPLCGWPETVLLYKGRARAGVTTQFMVTTNDFGIFVPIHRCTQCGFIFEQVGSLDLESSYISTEDPAYLEEEQGRKKTAERILKVLERRLPRGSLLDIGCFTGLFLSVAQSHGWQVQGLELSDWAVRTARERYHLTVHQGTLDTVTLPPQQLDLVTLIDVIEHLPHPVTALRQIAELLKPEGYVFISTPNVNAVIARLLGPRWWSYRLEHVSLFSPATLRRALDTSGFDVVATWTQGRDFTISYLASKLIATYAPRARPIYSMLTRWGFDRWMAYLDIGDQIAVLARKRG